MFELCLRVNWSVEQSPVAVSTLTVPSPAQAAPQTLLCLPLSIQELGPATKPVENSIVQV